MGYLIIILGMVAWVLVSIILSIILTASKGCIWFIIGLVAVIMLIKMISNDDF